MKRVLTIILAGGILSCRDSPRHLCTRWRWRTRRSGRGGDAAGWRWRCCAFRWRVFSLRRNVASSQLQTERSASLGKNFSFLLLQRRALGLARAVASQPRLAQQAAPLMQKMEIDPAAQTQGAVAGQRPANGKGAAGVAAGSRPTAGQLDKFIDAPGPATGAVGAAGAARAGGAAADFLQGGGKQLAAGVAGGAAVGAPAGVARKTLAGPELLDRSVPESPRSN